MWDRRLRAAGAAGRPATGDVVIPIIPARAAWASNAVGPKAVEQMLEGLIRSRQVWFELSVGHGRGPYHKMRRNATSAGKKVVNRPCVDGPSGALLGSRPQRRETP